MEKATTPTDPQVVTNLIETIQSALTTLKQAGVDSKTTPTDPQIKLLIQTIHQAMATLKVLGVDTKELMHQTSEILMPEEESQLTTACIKIHPDKLDLFRNIVHTKREMGFTDYTQTQAIHEAVNLLSQTMEVKDRGEKQRKKEQDKSMMISRAMKKRKNAPEAQPGEGAHAAAVVVG